MKEIPLTKGHVALVDDADYEWLSQWKWSYHSMGYACRVEQRGGKQSMILMHKAILNVRSSQYVDHKDHNRLNNQRSNLRPATPGQSACNMTKRYKPAGTTQYRGVLFHKDRPDKVRSKPWQARIRVNGKQKSLGYYATDIEAARAYDQASRQYHGEYGLLNFPEQV